MRGQITLFIIIAVVLIATVSTIVYIQEDVLIDEEVARAQLPSQSVPVFEYVKACMEQVGEEGLRRMGEKGGYIEHNLRVNRVSPTQGEAVQFSPGSDLEVPYWYYMKSDDACEADCEFATNRPAIKKPMANNMETQLSNYIEDNILECIDGFKAFREEGWQLTELGEPSVSTTIAKEGVNLFMEYPVTLTKSDIEIDVEEYATTFDVRLYEMYELGRLLAETEEEYAYLERNMYQLISLNEGNEAEDLPPHYNVEVSNKPGTIWIEREVKRKVMDLYAAYIPLMQVFGTSTYEYINAPSDIVGQESKELFEQLYNRNMLILPSMEADFPNIEANFVYLPWWEPYFDLNCRGELCKGENMMSTFIIPIGIQRYLFSYDISIPVLVRLRDPNAFNGKGLDFQFMIEGNLRNSEPASKNAPVVQMEEIAETLFCDPNKRTGTRIKLNVTDASTKKTLEDAAVTFTCGEEVLADGCMLGETRDGRFEIRLPKCIGGNLNIDKIDYSGVSIAMDSDLQETKTFDIPMQPVREMNFTLTRFVLDKQRGWSLDMSERFLSPEEEAVITLDKITAPGEEPFSAVAYIYGNQITNAKNGVWENVRLLPGTYEVEINTFLYPNYPLIIPPQLREYKGGLFGDGGSYMVPSEPIIFDYKNPMPYGGASFVWTVTPEELDSGNEINFFTIDFALDRVPENMRIIEDMQQMGKHEQYSQTYRTMIEPRIT